jgi:phage repressor protein C with HTH and peptisase S24 domain
MTGLENDRLLIRNLCAWAKLAPSAVAQRAKLTPSTILRAFNGKATTRISQPTIDKLRTAFPTFPGWRADLALDPSHVPSDEPAEIDPADAARRLELAEELDAVLLPEVEVSYSMGGGSVIEDWPVVRQVPFSRSWLRNLTASPPTELIVARGQGDSMMPTILDGDLVIIDLADRTPRQQDRIWAMSYGGWGMIKRLRQGPGGDLQLNSDNSAVSPIHAVDGEVQVVGRVAGIVRKI